MFLNGTVQLVLGLHVRFFFSHNKKNQVIQKVTLLANFYFSHF